MTESRPEDNYYNEYKGDYVESPMKWSDILLFPIHLILAICSIFIFSALPFLALILYFLHDVYTTLKKTVESGDLSYPFLAKAGGVLAIILAIAYSIHPENTPIHPSTSLILAIGFIVIFTILPFLALCLHFLIKLHSSLKTKIGGTITFGLYLVILGLLVAVIVFMMKFPPGPFPITLNLTRTQSPASIIPTQVPESINTAISQRTINILVDDFSPQPYQGESVYFFNRLEGDRGTLNNSIMNWGNGQVTTTISSGNSWGGVWMSLNHPIREGLSINFSAILPAQILPAYQSQITGITVLIAGGTPNRTFKLELKDGNELRWSNEIVLNGEQQVVSFDLPALGNINQLVWVLDRASEGDWVILDSVSFTATTQVTDTATAAFVWSYGMLLNNWNPATGLVRDKAKDASGEFDAIQATGSLAAATAIAEQLGVVSHTDATQIVSKIGDALLNDLPRSHGLWPHWVKTSYLGEISIVENTEWSSVDTVIAAVGLLEAQSGLGMDTSGIEQMLQEIEWDNLVTDKGISHGYTYAGDLIPYAWDAFGGESWLVELAYAGVTGQVAPLAYPSPPTANGSEFIDELAWLFVPPPSGQDYWGTDWSSYRLASADDQISYYATDDPKSCFAQLGLFGLSAGEVPSPAMVDQNNIYQAYGIGGAFAQANDGSALGAPVVAPHYSAMIASLRPKEAIKMWDWLIANGYFSPLINVESLMFPTGLICNPTAIEWNQLKGSWNLSLQTLGWGRYLAEWDGQIPVLWQAAKANPFLQKGYSLLAPNEASSVIPIPLPGEKISTLLESLNISCEGEPFSNWSLPGIYRYKITNFSGGNKYYFVEQTSVGRPSNGTYFDLPLSMLDSTIGPGGGVSTTVAGVETIVTKFGTFQATRVDTFFEYHYFSMNYPSGKVKISQWYGCGLGSIRATINHTGTYQTRSFQRQSELELFSFTPIP